MFVVLFICRRYIPYKMIRCDKKTLTPVRLGILIGFATSITFGLIYMAVLHGDGSFFYWFALPYFLAGPLIAGTVTAGATHKNRYKASLTSAGAVFGMAILIFVLTYALGIVLLITSVDLPSYCDSTYQNSDLPAAIKYDLPGGDDGIVVVEDASSMVVVKIDYERSLHPSTVLLIDKSDGRILWSADLPNDNIAAALDNDTAYIFYEGLGDLLDRRTGERIDRFVTMDNYGMNTNMKFQTTGIISIWYKDGKVKSLTRLTFNGIIQGCYIKGETGKIITL
jgi:hypothetical protein